MIDEGRWSPLAKLFVAITAFTVLLDGYDNQVLGLALPAIIKDWHVSKAAFAPIVAVGLIGMAVGAAVGGVVGDRIGRKMALIGSVLLFGAATGAVAGIDSLVVLTALRLLAGIGIGSVVPNASALAAEFSPRKSRSLAVAATIVCVPLGGMIGGLIASAVLPTYGWRVLFVLGGVAPVLLALLLFTIMPESPRYLARRSARIPELRRLLARLGHTVPEGAAIVDVSEFQNSGKVGVTGLFTSLYRQDTLVLWGAFFFSLFAVYTVFNWAPTMIASLGVGLSTASQAIAAYNFAGVLGAVSCAWVMGRFGSRLPMMSMAALGAASAVVLAVIATHASSQQLVLWMGLHGLFVNAVQTTLYSLAANIYGTDVRATGFGAALSVGRIGSIIGSFAGAGLVGGGALLYFLFLAVAMVGAGVCVGMIRRQIPALPKGAKDSCKSQRIKMARAPGPPAK
jgi:AAHS family 4-hydroxybenzoate transporter-like MFS transporter